MLKGLSLTELAKKIEGNRELKQDFITDTSKLQMTVTPEEVSGGKIISPARTLLAVGDHGRFPLLPLAHDQIGDRLQIPAKYYDRMLVQKPNLLATNVNEWLHTNPQKRMIRTLGGDARAFLSNKYQRIENEEIANAALPVLSELPQVNIVSCEITERRLYIHFVVPTIQGEVKVGDVVQAGGIIQNSEVGCGSVSVSGLIWRLWCLNGAKTGEAFRRNHVGRKTEDEGEMDWADDTRKADDQAVLLKVRDMVRAVVDETRFRATLSKMQGLTEGRITGDPSKAVEVLARKVGATEGEQGGILRALIEGADLSAWGMMNAVTAQAHTASSYDRAVEFEAMGGQVLDLPKSDWREVLEAA